MKCKRCEAAGVEGCAFKSGEFSLVNYCCETLAVFRHMTEEGATYNEDQWAAILPIKGFAAFIVLGWYKRRGRTEVARLLVDEHMIPLPLAVAEAALDGNADALGELLSEIRWGKEPAPALSLPAAPPTRLP